MQQSHGGKEMFAVYKCEICGMVFDEPYIREYKDPRPDGFWERFKQVLCPSCFLPYFHEIEEFEDGE